MAAAAARIKQEAARRDHYASPSASSSSANPQHRILRSTTPSSADARRPRSSGSDGAPGSRPLSHGPLRSVDAAFDGLLDRRRRTSANMASSSTSAFQRQPAAAEASTGSSMEWLTPDNAASYDYDAHAPKQFGRRSSEANLRNASDSAASMAQIERSTTPLLAPRRSSSRPNTPPFSATGREASSPTAMHRDALLRPSMNRSSEALSAAVGHNIRRPSSSNSPKTPFYLRSASLGIEDDNGSLHWDPEDRVPAVFMPQSFTTAPSSLRGTTPPSLSPSHKRSESALHRERDDATVSSASGPSEGASSSVSAAPAIPAKSSNRRPGSVFEHVGGMLDRFGRRLHSRSEVQREAGKRIAPGTSPQGYTTDSAEAVFVDDNSPSAVAGPSRPFSPGAPSPLSASRGHASSLHSDAPRSPMTHSDDQRSVSNRSSGAMGSPAGGMMRNLSAGSSRDLRGEANAARLSVADSTESAHTGPLERTLIQVTEDNERFAVVDISGLSTSAAIKERVMSKLHLFDDDPSCFALVRTEIGASGTNGPVLGDEEVLAMCYQNGDDRGSLKFLLRQIRPPAQPSRAAVPPPPAHPTSPRIVLRDAYEGSSATNPSTPTTNSRPPRSKSGSLSSRSSVGEVMHGSDSPNVISQHIDDHNRGFAVLSRPKAGNRLSMAMSSMNESGPNDGETAGAMSRSERRRDLSSTADEGARTQESYHSKRESQAYSSTDAYVYEQRRRSNRHSGSGDTAVSSMRATQPEQSRPVAQRTSSHPNPSDTGGSVVSASSPPASAHPPFPRSLVPGGRREHRLSDAADASQMYVTSPGTDISSHSAFASPSGPANAHQVRTAMSTDDMRRRSRLYNSSAESFQPQLERLQEMDPRLREAHLAAAGLGGPRQARGSELASPPDNRNMARLGVHGFDRERSASTGAGSAAALPSSRGGHAQGPEPWLDPRLASRVPQQQQQAQYAQPAYVQSLSGNAPRSRPSPGYPDPRAAHPQAQYRSNNPNAVQSSPRPAPPPLQYPSEFGAAPRAPHGHYNTVPKQHDPRMPYAQVSPQTLQDRSRFRPMHPPSRNPQGQPPPQQQMPYQVQPQHAMRTISDNNPYVHGHYPASNPRIVSDFQRLAPSQASLTPGKTVQEVLNPMHAPYHSSSQAPAHARLGPHQHPQPQHAGWQQASSTHRPSSASQSRSDGAYPVERGQSSHQDYVTSPPRPLMHQASALPLNRPKDTAPLQISRNASADVPASVKYFYNPSIPNTSGSSHSQQQGPSMHRPQPSTSSQTSSHDGRSNSSHRPYTTGTEAMAASRNSGSAAGERSSGSSFGSSGNQSHRRGLSSEENTKRNTAGSDSAPTSARSIGESPKPTARDPAGLHAIGRSARMSSEEIVDDDELMKMRPLPKPPAGMQYVHSEHGPKLQPSTEGEDTLRAGKLPHELFGRINLEDVEDGGTARAESTLRQSSRTKTTEESTSAKAQGASSSSGDPKSAIDTPDDAGTFANFDDEDEDEYDAQAGTWAQGLDSQPSASQSQAFSTQASKQTSEVARSPALGSVPNSPSTSTMSPRRPVLTLNIDSTTRAIGQNLPQTQPQDAQKAVAQTLLARSNPDNVSSSSSSGSGAGAIARSTSFAKRDRDWAFRPPPEQLYDNLDEYFPKHDLDKPILENGANASQQSPHASSPRNEVQPMSARSSGSATSPAGGGATLTRSKLAPKKSIRLVAQDRKRFLERAEAAEQRRLASGSDLARRPSTKLWGGRVVEMTPGVEHSYGSAAESPVSAVSSESRPVFKWVKGDLIGKGTYGRVYLALNATTGEMIAVKQVELPSTASDREDARQKGVVSALKSEIQTLKDLDHPHIVSYLGFEETTRNLSIFLEYVPGGSVGSCMRKHGKLDEATIKSFLHQILEGLSYLHGRGILHRDLKADNLLVDFNGIVKISDFGTVRKSEDIYGNVQSMSMQGSIFWMAPEVVSLKREGYSAKVDIWSLGCVVLEMFAGRRPWSDEEAVQAMFKIGAERRAPPIPPDVRLSKAAAHFLKKCFAVDPTERPTAARLLQHVFPHAEEGWQFSMSSLYRQLHR